MYGTEYSQQVKSDTLTAVRRQFGIDLTEVDTSGGNYVLQSRLESGHWIIACDPDLWDMRSRIRWEDENTDAMGWSVGIYPHGGDELWHGLDAIVNISHNAAMAQDLPLAIGAALAALAATARRDESRG